MNNLHRIRQCVVDLLLPPLLLLKLLTFHQMLLTNAGARLQDGFAHAILLLGDRKGRWHAVEHQLFVQEIRLHRQWLGTEHLGWDAVLSQVTLDIREENQLAAVLFGLALRGELVFDVVDVHFVLGVVDLHEFGVILTYGGGGRVLVGLGR